MSFVYPQHDYGDIIFGHSHNEAFQKKFENVQYNACLEITEAINGTSREKLYQELPSIYDFKVYRETTKQPTYWSFKFLKSTNVIWY